MRAGRELLQARPLTRGAEAWFCEAQRRLPGGARRGCAGSLHGRWPAMRRGGARCAGFATVLTCDVRASFRPCARGSVRVSGPAREGPCEFPALRARVRATFRPCARGSRAASPRRSPARRCCPAGPCGINASRSSGPDHMGRRSRGRPSGRRTTCGSSATSRSAGARRRRRRARARRSASSSVRRPRAAPEPLMFRG